MVKQVPSFGTTISMPVVYESPTQSKLSLERDFSAGTIR